MAIDRHIVDAVRDRTDIGEVIGRYVRLERRGNTLMGRCPFHEEKSPSFSVSPDKGLYYCFGCQAGGDVFRFVMQIEGQGFHEVVRDLARAAGVTIEDRELSAAERQALRKKASLRDVLEEAAAFFERQLWGSPGAAARRYLEGREMSREAARQARLGYAPDGWNALLGHLHSANFDADLVEAAGLAKKGTRGLYDTFRDRLMFPIRDERSRVIGFGARLLSGDGPKYLNTPETDLYHKSDVLYGLDVARPRIQRADRVIVVEGYFDVLSLHQAGFHEAVATCGTALTKEHLDRLRRLTRNLVLVLDSDDAGSRAAEKALPLCVEAGMQPFRVVVPGAKDPDELVRTGGAAAFEAALATKEPLAEWVVQRRIESHGSDAIGTERVIEDIAPLLASLPDLMVSRLAARLRVPEEALRRRMSAPKDAEPAAPTWKVTRSVVHLLWLLVHHFKAVQPVFLAVDRALWPDDTAIREPLAQLVAGVPVASVLDTLGESDARRVLLAVAARPELYPESQAAIGAAEILASAASQAWEARLRVLTRETEEAARKNDYVALRACAQERKDVISRRNALRPALNQGDVDAVLQLLAPSGRPPA